MSNNPADIEVLSWLLLGRAPYLEQQFSYRIQTIFDFAFQIVIACVQAHKQRYRVKKGWS